MELSFCDISEKNRFVLDLLYNHLVMWGFENPLNTIKLFHHAFGLPPKLQQQHLI